MKIKKKKKLKIECGNDVPSELRLSGDPANLEIEAQDPNTKGPPPLPKFTMAAYNGGPMKMAGWRYPIVVDIAGMSIPAASLPIRLNHDPVHGVGHTTQIDMNQNTRITAKGIVSRSTPAATEVVESGKKGFPWQASIGASVHEHEFVEEGKSARVNGRSLPGPLNIIRKSTLSEISFVDLGADSSTSASIAAKEFSKGVSIMLTAEEKAKIEEKAKVRVQAKADAKAKVKAAKADAEKIEAEAEKKEIKEPEIENSIADLRAQHAAELKRIGAITKLAGKNHEIAAKAIEEGWSEEKTELEAMRSEREALSKRAPNAIIGGETDKIEGGIFEAAIFQSVGGIKNLEKQYDDKTLSAAHSRFKGRLGLKQLLLEAAWASGRFTGRTFEGNHREVLEAAFSTLSLPGILSNNMNKFLMDSFNAVESTWRDVAAIRSVRDFKQASFYRLGGSLEYTQVGPHGELKSVSPAEVKYTAQANTWGAMLNISRQDIVNDDMGALAAAPRRLGRGAALALNRNFWTVFLSNPSNFFGTGHNNYMSGGSSPLAFAALQTAHQKFRDQTDPDGEPLGYPPATLLVPNALEVMAINLMRSQELRDTTASTKYGVTNVLVGRYKPVQSSYLSNSTIANNSATAWWLLADPKDLAVINVVFLNGQESPIVETAEADFDTLGIRTRAYHDFGCTLEEYRAGVMSAGV